MHSALILLEFGAVTLMLALMARLAMWVGLSPVPFYLLAGLMLGEGGVFPLVTSEEFIEIGAELGVLLLLFMLGLEYSASELMGGLRATLKGGLVDFAVNFAPGFGAGLLLGWSPLAATLLGGVTYISSSGIVAKLISDQGWLGNRETPAVLSVLVFEDLAMAVYLPLVAVLMIGGGLGTVVVSVFTALAAVTLVLMGTLRWGDRWSQWAFHRSDEALLLTILGVTLVVAGLAERVNVSAAVGAFLVGIALSGEAADRARPVLSPLRDLFAATFFVFFGLRTDPADIPPVALVAVALAVVTAATKLVTGWVAAAPLTRGPRARIRAGALLVARGEFSIIIASLAVGIPGGSEVAALAAAYVLLMAVVGPLLTKASESLPLPSSRRQPAPSEDVIRPGTEPARRGSRAPGS